MIRFAGLVLLLGFAAGSAAAPVPVHLMPKGDPVCYPLRVGTVCIHQLEGGEVTFRVTKVEKVAGGHRVATEVVDGSNGNFKSRQVVVVSGRGVDLIEHNGQVIDPPVSWLKLPHAENNSWSAKWPQSGTKFDFTTRGWEVVEVPAGRFRAIKVERVESVDGQVQGTTTYWYSPGLGCIKIAGRSPARVLKSVSFGKE
jgi:hypothetical protein